MFFLCQATLLISQWYLFERFVVDSDCIQVYVMRILVYLLCVLIHFAALPHRPLCGRPRPPPNPGPLSENVGAPQGGGGETHQPQGGTSTLGGEAWGPQGWIIYIYIYIMYICNIYIYMYIARPGHTQITIHVPAYTFD